MSPIQGQECSVLTPLGLIGGGQMISPTPQLGWGHGTASGDEWDATGSKATSHSGVGQSCNECC